MASITQTPLISVDSVSKAYIGNKTAVKGQFTVQAIDCVSLEVGRGEFVSIVGESGCGKSTLLRLISGLDTATSGEITFEGEVIRRTDPARAVMFQTYGLLPWRTVLANVELAMQVQRVRKRDRREVAMEMIERLGLAGFERSFPSQLSGGMRQRVALARALTKRPKVLLMDEPFAAVDLRTREHLQEELLSVWQEVGCAVVFVTHGIEEAVFLSDRVVVMRPRPGRVVEEVDVALPRPRLGLESRTSAEFAQLCAKIRGLLENAHTT
jgi:NitT/TauT family transport system ATP-binding protein